MDSGFAFFGFVGTSGDIPSNMTSGEIQLWNLTRTPYNQFKNKLMEATGMQRIHDDRFSEKTYDRCKWGLLLPYVYASNSSLVLTNLFSEQYLYPFFYFERGLPVDMTYSLPRFWHELNHHTQNPISFSSQTKLDSFQYFYDKLQEASPFLTLHTDKLYGIQKKRIYKAVQIFERIGQTYTSLDNDHEAFYLDLTRLLECLLIDDEFDPRGFCAKEYLKKRCQYLVKYFDFANVLQGVSASKTLNKVYGYRNKFAHGKTYLELNIMSMRNQASGALGENANLHFTLRDEAKTLLRSILASYLHLLLHKQKKADPNLRKMPIIEALSRMIGIPWQKRSRSRPRNSCRTEPPNKSISRKLLSNRSV